MLAERGIMSGDDEADKIDGGSGHGSGREIEGGTIRRSGATSKTST
jgi:hypothetical protein